MGNCGLIGAFSSTSDLPDKVLNTNGQILYYDDGRKALDKEDDDDVLTLKAGLPSWEAAAAGSTPLFMLACQCEGASNRESRFLNFFANYTTMGSTTENENEFTMNTTFTIIRNQANFPTNTMNAAVTLSFRDDSSSLATLTITAATTGQFDSGAVDLDIAAGSDCCFNRDASGTSSGTHTFINMVSCTT